MAKMKRFDFLRMVVLLLISIAISAVQGNSQSPGLGIISGKVINVLGEPISDAHVSVERVGVVSMQWPSTETDSDGKFVLTGLMPGTYKLHAAKGEDGYAPTYSVFRADDLATEPQVSIIENQTAQNIVVQLGRKGGWLTGRVVSAATDKPITDAQIVVRRVDDPTKFFSTGLNDQTKRGAFKMLVPTAPFTVEVTAAGYDSWKYSENKTEKSLTPLILTSGETRQLTIRLHPKE